MAAALRDWERRRDVLPVAHPRWGTRRLADVAADLSARPPGTWRNTYDLHGVARRPELAAALDGLALDEQTLDDLSSFALAVHVAADAFVSLHLVTGARAVRRVAELLDEDLAMRLAAATATTASVLHAAVGAPPLLPAAELGARRGLALPSPQQVAERAVADRDPHVIKLANVALVEAQRTGDPLYRFVAARVVGLVAHV